MIDMEELAKRAVACKAWRWMQGMRSTETTLWCGHSWSDGRRSWEGDTEDALPDLTDPATLGCLLHLVREHLEDNGACLRRDFRSNGTERWTCEWLCPKPGVMYYPLLTIGATEAETLVEALEMEIHND